jgi:Zn-dependent protease
VGSKLDNPINWSFKVGRLFGIDIRLHLLFVFGALVLLAAEIRDGLNWIALQYAVGQIVMLFAIVLAHEFGHCFGARLTGGEAREILMWPLGGLAYTSPPHTARANLITAAAGPLVNVLFLIFTAAIVLAWLGTPAALPLNPFKPFVTAAPVTSSLHDWLVIFFTLNLILLLFNLAPVFPLDGGRILQCLLWPRRGYRDATNIASGIGMVGAIAFGVIGLFTREILLFAIAFFGYFTCWQQRQMLKAGMFDAGNEFGYDFSQGYTSLERGGQPAERKPSYWERRRARREAEKARREVQRREEHRRLVDEILEKVHRSGIASLTPKERRILEEETNRQRTQG